MWDSGPGFLILEVGATGQEAMKKEEIDAEIDSRFERVLFY